MQAYAKQDVESDSILIQFVTLALSYTPAPESQAMYVTFTESELGYIVAPYLPAFVEPDPDDGFILETDGVWRLNYPAEVGHYRKAEGGETVTSLSDFLDCVEERTAAACATSLIVCPFTAIAYPEWVAAGCAGGAIASIILCAFTEWG